jgi:type I restriction enzyme R subunit
VLDLSKVNFQELATRFLKSDRQNIELERVRVIRLNDKRNDFIDKFQRLIDEYNAGSKEHRRFHRKLVELSKDLSEQDRRHVRENLSEQELAIFDLLTRPEPPLSADQWEEVNKVARKLLVGFHSLLGLD